MKKIKLISRVLIVSSIINLSCKKLGETINGQKNQVTIKIQTNISNFSDEIVNPQNQANSSNIQTIIKDTIININNDIYIQGSIEREKKANTPTSNKLHKKNNLLSASQPLQNNTWYKLLVYNTSTGNFITERTYQKGNENNLVISPILKLDGGVTYTFIAYSVNSTNKTELDAIMITGSTLSTARTSISNNIDFLLWTSTKTISGEPIDDINIEFEHIFNVITFIIDASATGYSVQDFNAKLITNQSTATINLNQKTITRSGNSRDIPLPITPYTPVQIPTVGPIVINAANANNSISISKLEIGAPGQTITAGTVASPLTPFTNITLAKGYKYNIKLTINAQDKTDTIVSGQKAIRINNQIWMQYNLGADNSINLNTIYNNQSAVEGLVGNYYKFGNKTVVATTSTPAT